MIRPMLSACLLWPLLAPIPASALTVEIQGTRLDIHIAGASCVEITGSYPGVRIEASQNGKIPRVCYNNSSKVNSIAILDATFIATDPVQKDVSIKLEHEFPPGINGKVMSRAKLQGFFSMPGGAGVPAGDKLSFAASFSQSGQEDAIAEPFNLTVGDDIDSALFDYSVKEQYLIAGPRRLRGVLTLFFVKPGHKLVLAEKSGISLDTGSTMADKLESLEPDEGGSGAAAPEGQNPDIPTEMPRGGQPPEPAPAAPKPAAPRPQH